MRIETTEIMHKKKFLSAVVPVYRNQETLETLYKTLSPLFHEIVFVNDASPDGSAKILDFLALQDPRVRVIHLDKNLGQNRAVLRGLAACRGEIAVILDADLQDPVDAIPRLLEKMNGGFDAVFAGRCGAYESKSRLFASRIFKKCLHWIAKTPLDAGLFAALSRKMIERVLQMTPYSSYVVGMIGLAGLPICSIAVERRARENGISAYSNWSRFKLGAWAIFHTLRLRRLLRRALAPLGLGCRLRQPNVLATSLASVQCKRSR